MSRVTLAHGGTGNLKVEVDSFDGPAGDYTRVESVSLIDGSIYVLHMRSGAIYTMPAASLRLHIKEDA